MGEEVRRGGGEGAEDCYVCGEVVPIGREVAGSERCGKFRGGATKAEGDY